MGSVDFTLIYLSNEATSMILPKYEVSIMIHLTDLFDVS